MKFEKIKNMVEQLHPGKKVDVVFDDSCIQKIDFSFVEGKANITPIIEYTKVKIVVEGSPSAYVAIPLHRQGMAFKDAKKKVNNIKDFLVTKDYATNKDEQAISEELGISLEEASKLRNEALAKEAVD